MLYLMGWPCTGSHPEGALLRVRVTPGARRTEAVGLRADRLALRVQAPPVDGQANVAVCKWVAKAFGIRLSQVRLLRGEHAREKDLLLAGLTPEQAAAALQVLLPGEVPPDQIKKA